METYGDVQTLVNENLVTPRRESAKSPIVITKQLDTHNFVMNLSPDSSEVALQPVGGGPWKKKKKKKTEPSVIQVAPGQQVLKVVMSKPSES